MVTRKLKPTVVITPVEEIVHAAPSAKPTLREHLHILLDEALAEDQIGWKRELVAWVLSLSASFGIGYGVGTLLNYMIVGMTVLSSSVFLSMVVYFLGIMLAIHLGRKATMFVYLGVVERSFETSIAAGYNKVRGWFGSSAIEPVAS
jgi:hypothetical protein